MKTKRVAAGRTTVRDLKRTLILDAARRIFEAEGLDGASLRAIAAEAGYAPAALYFHFDSKEAIYAEVLRESLMKLNSAVERAVAAARGPSQQLRAAAIAFFEFYAQNPGDLDLGFYLFRGGIKPHGPGRKRNVELNAALSTSLRPIVKAAEALGAAAQEANLLMIDAFAHAVGLLLLANTGRLRMLGGSAPELMARYISDRLRRLQRIKTRANH